jgi:hypothetical protein
MTIPCSCPIYRAMLDTGVNALLRVTWEDASDKSPNNFVLREQADNYIPLINAPNDPNVLNAQNVVC